MSILAVGSVAFDTLKTPFGEVDKILGGAVSHFALAASFFAQVNVVAVVGEDFTDKERDVFKGKSIDLSGLQTAPGKTFRWGGEYSYDLNERTTLFTELNVFENFQPTIPNSYRTSGFVFLGNIHPTLQVDVVKQVKSPKLIAADTMNYWIEGNPKELRQMLEHVDVLMINDAETRQLSGEYNLVRGAEKIHKLGPKTLVVKRGEHGVLLFNEKHRFAAPAYPLETVFDPTGAGDTFAGGFMGYLASRPSVDDQALRQAIIFGSTLGSFCVEDFGTRRLESISREDVVARYREFKKLTHFEDI